MGLTAIDTGVALRAAIGAMAILFVLDDGAHGLDPQGLQSFDACMELDGGIAPTKVSLWDMEDLARVDQGYAETQSTEVRLKSEEAESLLIGLPDQQWDGFLFLSRQRFSDWHAYGDS